MDFKEFEKKSLEQGYTVYEIYFIDYEENTRFKCQKHGLQIQTPKSIIEHGCFKCKSCIHKAGKCELCKGNFSNYEEFLILSKQIHKDAKIKNIDDHTVQVYCERHGWVKKLKHDHLRSGCQLCYKSLGTKDHWIFINSLIRKYGFSMDLSQCKYVNENTKVIINGELIAPKTLNI